MVLVYYILYNPLSSNGSSLKVAESLGKKLAKAGKEYQIEDLLIISNDVEAFVKGIYPTDPVILIGGDGTLHRFSNYIYGKNIPNPLYLYKAGTGNDFSREFKKEHLINIKKALERLPKYRALGKEEYFLNCTGFGVDGEVCSLVNNTKVKKKGINYLQNALKTFKNFKHYDLEVTVDGVRHTFKKVWLATVMNGNYFGGGMKLSPYSNRFDDVMECYVIHHVPFFKLIFIFPFIFIGKHLWFKSVGITCLKGHKFNLKASIPETFQSDGEVMIGVSEIDVGFEE